LLKIYHLGTIPRIFDENTFLVNRKESGAPPHTKVTFLDLRHCNVEMKSLSLFPVFADRAGELGYRLSKPCTEAGV